MYKKIFKWYFGREALPIWSILAFDLFVCFVGGVIALLLFKRPDSLLKNADDFAMTLLVCSIINLVFFKVFHTYRGVMRYSSFVDLKKIVYAMACSFLVVTAIHLFTGGNSNFAPLRIRYIVAMYSISCLLMVIARVVIKNIYDIVSSNKSSENAMVYGVADGGVAVANLILSENPRRFNLVGFISHDESLKTKKILGVDVYKDNEHLLTTIIEKRVKVLVVSPLRNEQFRQNERLQNMLLNNNIRIFMLDEANNNVDGSHLNQVTIEDLLPRDEIKVDLTSISKLINGKKVLITGSAGSIGSEMVRQISKFEPEELILIDQAETPQHDIRLMMKNKYPYIKAQTIVASIQDANRMENIFSNFKPDYVFHAAAYKHVPMMEDNPSGSVENNVVGTRIIADLSVKYGVKKFVMISTDKAVNPTNVMGCSKRICEIYVQSLDLAIKQGKVKGITQFVTTRFGNVLGSSGSVIPIFREQIKNGGPVTVTHPDIIRFFMLIPEACKLVLEAGTKGNGGEIFVFDMGDPVRIADLAERMIKLSGAKNVKIIYTGLRDGEKLFEETLANAEHSKPTFNKKIRIAAVREYDYDKVCQEIDRLASVALKFNDMLTVSIMKEIVPEYKSNHSVYEKLDNKESEK